MLPPLTEPEEDAKSDVKEYVELNDEPTGDWKDRIHIKLPRENKTTYATFWAFFGCKAEGFLGLLA